VPGWTGTPFTDMTAVTQGRHLDVGHMAAPLVGRAAELTWLDQALATVRGGSPATVLIGGDAGAGKTRLVTEFAAMAGATARVLTGWCPELGPVGLPFAPFTDILRELARDRSVPAFPPGGELLRLFPELSPPPVWGAGEVGGDAKAGRARLFVQMLSLLERVARRQPLVLIIENVHWADESTRDLISFLVDNQDAMDGVLIILTYRSDEVHRGHPLAALLSGLGRFGWVLRTELSGLSRGESDKLIELILGSEPPKSLAEALYRRTAGNPMLTGQLACRAQVPGVTARDVMLAAVCRLPEDTQDVLRAASVGGQRIGQALLATVTELDATALTAVLRPAVAADVIEIDADSFAFRHSLTGEVLHQDLLPCEHTRMHQRFAIALQNDPDLVPAGRAVFEEAEHWQHAHDPARSLGSAWQAAAQAGKLLACAEQLAMLTRVLELWPCVPEAPSLTGSDQAHVLRSAAEAARAAGHLHLSSALASARYEPDGCKPPTAPASIASPAASPSHHTGSAPPQEAGEPLGQLLPESRPVA
jgi:hypothetical protein